MKFKFTYIFISAIVLFLCLNSNSYSDEFEIPKHGEVVYNKIAYKYEEYLFLPWGTKEGEVMYDTEKYPFYQTNFYMDIDGNIYIDDCEKNRTLKISPKKEIRYFEKLNGVSGVLNNGDIITWNKTIYDKNGNYKYSINNHSYYGEIFQNKNGNIYYQYRCSGVSCPYSQFQRIEILDIKSKRYDKEIKDIPEGIQIPSGYSLFLPSRYTDTRFLLYSPCSTFYIKAILPNNSSSRIEIDVLQNSAISGEKTFRIEVLQSTIITEYQHSWKKALLKSKTLLESKTFVPDLIPKDGKICRIDLISSDAEDNVYCLIHLENYKNEEGLYYKSIYKFSKDGELLLIIRPFKCNTTDFIEWQKSSVYRVDKYGNIYQLHISDKGVHIAKWGITNEQH